jgi:hypothetical protein
MILPFYDIAAGAQLLCPWMAFFSLLLQFNKPSAINFERQGASAAAAAAAAESPCTPASSPSTLRPRQKELLQRLNQQLRSPVRMSLVRPPSRANSIEAPRGGGLSGFAPPPTTRLAAPVGSMSRPLSAGGQARKSAAAAVAGDGVRAAMGWGAPPTTLSRPPSAGGSNRPGIASAGYTCLPSYCHKLSLQASVAQ